MAQIYPPKRVYLTWRTPGLNVDFRAVCNAIRGAWAGSGGTVTSVAARFGVSRGWIHKWVYPELGDKRPIPGGKANTFGT